MKMKTKFTKGPWILDYGMVVIGDINYELDNAYDAPLIACAPDMYEMLEKVVQAKHETHCEIEHSDMLCDLHNEIESLLKRARGE